MRAALIQEWPALSLYFGIHPWDVGRLSPIELKHYRAAAAEQQRRR